MLAGVGATFSCPVLRDAAQVSEASVQWLLSHACDGAQGLQRGEVKG